MLTMKNEDAEDEQVVVFLAYTNLTHPDRLVWTWVDGELFLQKHWFSPEMAEKRQQVGIPPDREFETKIELGWKMIQRVEAGGLPFEAVACDDLYGQCTWLRDNLDKEGMIYVADVPCTTRVYLDKAGTGSAGTSPRTSGTQTKPHTGAE